MLSRSNAVWKMDWCKSCRAGTGNLTWPEIGGVALAAWLTDIWSDRTTLTIWFHPRYSSLFFSNGRACKRFFWLLSEVLQEETGQLYCPFSNKWTQWPKRVVIIGLRGNSVKSFPPWSFTSMLSVHHDLNSELPVRNLGYTWYWLFPDHDFGDTSSPFHAISKIPTIRSIDLLIELHSFFAWFATFPELFSQSWYCWMAPEGRPQRGTRKWLHCRDPVWCSLSDGSFIWTCRIIMTDIELCQLHFNPSHVLFNSALTPGMQPSKNGIVLQENYLLPSSGGEVSWFNLEKIQVVITWKKSSASLNQGWTVLSVGTVLAHGVLSSLVCCQHLGVSHNQVFNC